MHTATTPPPAADPLESDRQLESWKAAIRRSIRAAGSAAALSDRELIVVAADDPPPAQYPSAFMLWSTSIAIPVLQELGRRLGRKRAPRQLQRRTGKATGPRIADGETAEEAVERMLSNLSDLQDKVLSAMHQAGLRGLTDRELGRLPQFAKLAKSTAAKRRDELVAAGLVKPTGYRRQNRNVWRALKPDELIELLQATREAEIDADLPEPEATRGGGPPR